MQGGLILGASSGEVTRFNLDKERRVWRASADTTIMTPPIVEGENVYAVGFMGSVLAVSDKEGRMFWKWQPKKPSRLISGIALRDGKVYVGDQLGYLYCITAQDGVVLWKYPTGAPILVNPMPIDGKLVVFTHGGETLCLALKDEGPTLLWQHPDAERPIALGRSGLLYVLTRDQSVACISLDTGKENWRVPLGKGCLITSDSTQPTFCVYRRGGGVMAITELH
jgi:outer membrane protein assembly factor BamB